MRKVIAMLEVDDNIAYNEGFGTIEYVERECGWLAQSGILLRDARVLDDDDTRDAKAIVFANAIFEEVV